MHMSLDTHRWTRADLEHLPEDGNKYEVVRGELLVSPAPRPAHDALVRVFWRILDQYCDRSGIAHVSGHLPVFVSGDSEAIPDIVVREPAVPPPEKWDHAPIPMLVVEILSDATRRTDMVRKRRFYIESGISEYWIVDGDTRSARVITRQLDHQEFETLRWTPGGAPTALEIDLRQLFEAALGRGT